MVRLRNIFSVGNETLIYPTLLTECFLWYEVLRWWLMMMDLYHQGRNVFNSPSHTNEKERRTMKWNGWDRKKETKKKGNEMMASLVVVMMMRKYHQITDRHKGMEKTIGRRKTVRNRHDFSILFSSFQLFSLSWWQVKKEGKANSMIEVPSSGKRGFNQLQEQHQNISHDDLRGIETIKNVSLCWCCVMM